MTTDPHAPATPTPHPGPLAGVRILDIATVLAAPLAATLCADLGAEVVKAELPGGVDPLRGLEPVKAGIPLFWKVANRGKRGITLDLRKPQGRELLLRLLPRFDVLVENFRPGTLDRWGLDRDTLRAVNPRLAIVRLTGFGQDGPYSERPGFARIFEALSGLARLNGAADGAPLHMNFPIGDVVAGLFGAFTIASAVAAQRAAQGGPPLEFDLSATEAMFRLIDSVAVEHEQLGVTRIGAGNQASYTAPSNMYRAGDGVWFTLVASSNPIFRRLGEAIGRPGLADDERFSTMGARVRHKDELDAILSAWFAARPFEAVRVALEPHEVPFAKVQSIADIEQDPHFRARQAIIRLPDPDVGSVPASAIVPRLVGQDLPVPRSGPAPGEHNREVYGWIGLGEDDLARLRGEGVI